MLTVNLGPFPVSIHQLLVAVALLVALGIGHWVGRRQQTGGIGNVLSDMTIGALLAARIGFVAIWFDIYRLAPWSVLDIRDGGFTLWAGVLAALLIAIWHGGRHAALRKPLVLGLAAGAFVWGGMFGALRMTEKERPALPTVLLTTPAGQPAELVRLAAGKPMVVNLWASWCPPCQREMPVLATAQQQQTGVIFVFANQGEEAVKVQSFLSARRLDLANVLLDPGTALGKAVGSTALPTTLFYDASGRLVDVHLGELSAASLASKLRQLRVSPIPSFDK